MSSPVARPKSDSTDAEHTIVPRGLPISVTVLLDSSEPPGPNILLKEPVGGGEASLVGNADWSSGVLAFDATGSRGTITFIPSPLPQDVLSRACTDSFLWPEAEKTLRGHKSQLVITCSDPSRSSVQTAFLLSEIAATVARNAEASAIYWNAAGLVHALPMFSEHLANATADEPPTILWVGFTMGLNAKDRRTAFTRGLDALGFHAIEANDVKDPAGKMPDFVVDLASFILSKGADIKDGHTVGGPSGERIACRLGPSKWLPNAGKTMLVLGIRNEFA